MARNPSSRRDRPTGTTLSGPDNGVTLEVQEFVRLYMAVDEGGRRFLEKLVRQAVEQPMGQRVLH